MMRFTCIGTNEEIVQLLVRSSVPAGGMRIQGEGIKLAIFGAQRVSTSLSGLRILFQSISILASKPLLLLRG